MRLADIAGPAAPRRWAVRLAPLLALLGLILFPVEWLGARWPVVGRALDHAFPDDLAHAIAHASLFVLLGLLALAIWPALRARPLRYAGLLLAGLGQELLQLLFKRRALALDDGRDLLVDALGLALAFALAWMWRRSAAARIEQRAS